MVIAPGRSGAVTAIEQTRVSCPPGHFADKQTRGLALRGRRGQALLAMSGARRWAAAPPSPTRADSLSPQPLQTPSSGGHPMGTPRGEVIIQGLSQPLLTM